jgi:hypothetical protein
VVEFVVAIDEARVRFTDDAHFFLPFNILLMDLNLVVHVEYIYIYIFWSTKVCHTRTLEGLSEIYGPAFLFQNAHVYRGS